MVSMDELIKYAMEDFHDGTDKEELEFLRNTKPILRDELLTCYQFLKEKELMDEYKNYRG